MVPGGTGAVDTIFVTHETDGKPDGVSTLTFKGTSNNGAFVGSTAAAARPSFFALDLA